LHLGQLCDAGTSEAASAPRLVLASGGGVDTQLAELPVERRTADTETPRDLGHAAAIMADGEADDVGLDILQRSKMPVTAVECDAWLAAQHLLAPRFAHRRREVR